MTIATIRPKSINNLRDNKETVLAMYNGSRKSIRLIAKMFNTSGETVYQFLYETGVRKPKPKHWSERELNLLREYLGKYPVTWIARKLRRSRSAIIRASYIYDIGCLREHRSEWYTINDLEMILGINKTTLYRYVQNGIIKSERYMQESKGMYYISRENLVKFIQQYAMELRYKKVDILSLIDILVGIDRRKVDMDYAD